MNTKQKNTENDNDVFNIKNTARKFIENWKVYVISVIIFIGLGILFIVYSTAMYRINAEILVQDQDTRGTSSSFLNTTAMSDFGDLLGIQSNVYNEMAILQSKDILNEVVRGMNLNIRYFMKNGLVSKELYLKTPFVVHFVPKTDSIPATTFDIDFTKLANKGIFKLDMSNTLIDTTLTGKFNDTIYSPIGKLYFVHTAYHLQNAPYTLQIISPDAMIAQLVTNLTFDIANTNATVISISYNSNIPQKGEDIVNRIIYEYTKRNLTEKNRISDSSLSFINSRVNIVNQELNDIELQLQNFKQSNQIADLSEQARVLIDNSSTYNQKLNEIEVQLNVANSTLQYIQDDKNNTRPVPSVLSTDPIYVSLVSKYNELISQRERAGLTMSDNNPIISNLDTQIKNARADVEKNIRSQIQGFKASEDKLMSENGLISSMVRNVPVQERQFVSLSREQNVKQALYLYLLQKKEETSITEASNIPSANTIQKPKSDFQPYFPKMPLILGASLILGLLVPAGFMTLKDILHNRIESREDITDVTDVPIIAEIGHNKTAGVLSLEEEGRSVLAEQFRALRTNLDFTLNQAKTPVVLITSSLSGEGKSFIAVNLSQMYAYSGKKVLIMELDLRKPHISEMLGVKNDKGFSNYVVATSNVNVNDYIKPVPNLDNIFIMTSGPVPPNPAEILMQPKVTEMFEYIINQFDAVIVDTSPIGLVIDAQILAKHSTVNLYVVRERYTFKNNLQLVNDLIEEKKFPNLYLVINDVKKGASYKYGYGYGYGYRYGGSNGAGYFSDKKKTKKRLFSRS